MRRYPLLEPDFLRFCGRTLLHIPASLWEASKGCTTLASVAAFYLALSPKLAEYGLSVFGNISPLWALLPVEALFLLGLMRAPFEEHQRLRAEKKALEDELAAYKDAGKPKVIARIKNPSPVSIPEDEPYIIDPPKYPTHGHPVTCLAPYNDHGAATTVEIEDTQSEYDVVVSYDVRSVTDEFSAAHYTMSIEARVWVVGENGKKVRNLDFYRGRIDVAEDGS